MSASRFRLACAKGAAWVLGRRSVVHPGTWELVATLPASVQLPSGLRRTTAETLIGLVAEATHSLRLTAPYVDPEGIGFAAQRAAITVPELSQRLLEVPGGEDLFLKTIRAATDVALDDKLIALSQSLASAVSESSPITFESQLVGVIADLDVSHFVVLDYLLTSANDLGFSKSDVTDPVKTLNMVQLKMFAPQDIVELAEPLFAGLERHGLVNGLTFSGGIGGGSPIRDQWEITTFGEAVVERMRTIGAFLRPR
jgi:hypothetical protein